MNLSFASDTLNLTSPLQDGETLISNKHVFVLGFFSPGDSRYRFLGMWYKNIPQTVVWVANRNNPVKDRHGVLTFSKNGNLVILNLAKNIIWSSNVSRVLENPVARLLDSGNFVLMGDDLDNNYLWQSFDYPSDTLLADMNLVWSLNKSRERYLTSWKSLNDPSTGDFTLKLDSLHVSVTLVIYHGSEKLFRFGPFNGRTLGYPTEGLTFQIIVKFVNNETFYTYKPFIDTQISLLTLNQSGMLNRLIWSPPTNEWVVLYGSDLNRPCQNYSYCGSNSICTRNKAPNCECLGGFVPNKHGKKPDQLCKRGLPLDCEKAKGDKFQIFHNVEQPDMLNVWINEDMNLTECKAKCLTNCSCSAYSTLDVGTGCLLWFGDLIDFKEMGSTYQGLNISIRVPAPIPRPDRGLRHKADKKNGLKKKLVLSLTFTATVLIIGLMLCFVLKKLRKKGLGEDMEVPLFDFTTICAATANFSEANVLGAGGFGMVYKGNLLSGEQIAVKRLSKSSQQGISEFKNEINLIGQLQHRNLVALVGICIQKEEQMLIYEYMSNKSLDHFIFDPERKSLLPWSIRFDIVKGIARGLLYLHQDSKLQIIHRDLKAANILLDDHLSPKISDFGLARLFGDGKSSKTNRVVGTFGYMSPEYAIEGIFSEKSDVYSFGVLLLEIVSGKKNRGFHSRDHFHNLLGHAWLLWREDRALEIMEVCLDVESLVERQVHRCIHVSLLCVQKFSDDRPTMSSVLNMFANEETALPEPKEPGFFTERSHLQENSTPHSLSDGAKKLTITTLEGR